MEVGSMSLPGRWIQQQRGRRMKKLIIVAVLLVFIGGGVGMGIFWYVRQNTGQRLLNKATLALQAKNYQRAANLAEQYIAETPEDWHGHNMLGQACLRLGRHDDAREAFREATRLEPSEVGPIMGLASSYALSADRDLTERDTSSPIAMLKEAIDGFARANEVILKAKTTNAKGALDLRERLGRDYRSISVAWRMIGDRLAKEADRADKARLQFAADLRRDASVNAMARADEAAELSIKTLLAVVTEDPSRPKAARELVDLCIQRGDVQSLAGARKAIMGTDNPPALAAMSLALHDLRAARTSDQKARRLQLEKFCRTLDRLIEIEPNELLIKLARAEAAYMLKDYPTAERIINTILAGNPRQGRARLIRAGIYMARRKFIKAHQELFTLKMDFPKWAEAHYAFALAAIARGQKDPAMWALRITTELDPTHAGARHRLAEALGRLGHYTQAFADAKAYYDAHPHDPMAVKMFVRAAVGMDKPQLAEAHQALEKALAQHPTMPEMMYAIGEGYAFLGKKTKARQIYGRTTECTAKSREGRLAVAKAMREIGRLSEAENAFVRELARDAEQPHVHFELSRICTRTGRPLQAVEHLRNAIRLDGQDPRYRLALAQFWFDAGDIDQCEKVLAELDVKDVEANLLRLRVKLVMRRTISAEEMISQVDRKGLAGLALAMTYLKTGRPQWCANVCEATLKKTPEDSALLFLLGQTYHVLGQRDKCIKQWSLALTAAPGQLPAYLSLAGLLAGEMDPPEVAKALSKIPGTRKDMIALTIGWLQFRRGDLAASAATYGRLADDARAPEYSRKRASLLRARSLASAGQGDKALAELDILGRDTRWARPVLQVRADILSGAGRNDEALAVLVRLGEIATGEKDGSALRGLVGQMMRLDRFNEALALCDRVRDLLPDDSRTYLLRAAVLGASGRHAEMPTLIDKAITLQPGDFKLYVALATTLDSLERPVEALDALKRMESVGRTGAARALFERGQFLARWGLVAQADKCFAQLDAKGHCDNPSVQLAVGRALAAVGSHSHARKVLAKVPRHCDQYVPAQIALAALADGPEAGAAILSALGKTNPDNPDVLRRRMQGLIRDAKGPEAVEAFKAFTKRTGRTSAVPDGVHWLAVDAMLQADDRKAAADFARKRAGQTRRYRWRYVAVLLSIAGQGDVAAGMLPEPAKAGLYDAMLGVILSARKKDPAARALWAAHVEKICQLAAKRQPPVIVPPRYRLLAALAGGAGRDKDELTALAKSAKVGPAAGLELVDSRTRAEAPDEAAALLEAVLAADWGLSKFAQTRAISILEARPTCQWAAALVMLTRPDSRTHRKVVDLLRPTDCALSLRIRGSLRRDQGAFGEAAGLYARAAEAADGDPALLYAQAVATQRAGKLQDALGLYRKIFQATKDPQAANNAAFIVTQLHPENPAKLTEALAWANAAVEADPNDGMSRDTRGWLLFLLGKMPEARSDIRRAVKSRPGSPEVQYHAGVIEAKASRVDLSRWHFEAAAGAAERIKARGRKLTVSANEAAALAREALTRASRNDR